MDIGCASGYISRELGKKGYKITGVDRYAPPSDVPMDTFRHCNGATAGLWQAPGGGLRGVCGKPPETHPHPVFLRRVLFCNFSFARHRRLARASFL